MVNANVNSAGNNKIMENWVLVSVSRRLAAVTGCSIEIDLVLDMGLLLNRTIAAEGERKASLSSFVLWSFTPSVCTAPSGWQLLHPELAWGHRPKAPESLRWR